MAKMFFALMAGGLFGLGLMISGMTDTAKVQGFLDITGAWDPTLMFVMGGAIIPMAIAWRTAKRTEAPMLGGAFPARPAVRIDRDLVLGSLMFGAGWALAGLCPGPALASLSYGGSGGLAFASAMVLGMLAAPKLKRSAAPKATARAASTTETKRASKIEPTLRALPTQTLAPQRPPALGHENPFETVPAQPRAAVIQGPALALPAPQKDI